MKRPKQRNLTISMTVSPEDQAATYTRTSPQGPDYGDGIGTCFIVLGRDRDGDGYAVLKGVGAETETIGRGDLNSALALFSQEVQADIGYFMAAHLLDLKNAGE